MNVRTRDGLFGPVYTLVTRTAAGTQDVSLEWHNLVPPPTVLGTMSGFPSGMIRIRMVVDTFAETVSLSADGVPIVTTSYSTLPTIATEQRWASLASFETVSEFASVSVTRCPEGL